MAAVSDVLMSSSTAEPLQQNLYTTHRRFGADAASRRLTGTSMTLNLTWSRCQSYNLRSAALFALRCILLNLRNAA